MDITAIPPIGETGEGAGRSFQAVGHNFMLRVQGAIGPKALSGYGIEGRVIIAFSLGNDGRLQALRIARSSGYALLDRAAVQVVSAAAFPSPPTGLTVVQRSYISAFSFS